NRQITLIPPNIEMMDNSLSLVRQAPSNRLHCYRVFDISHGNTFKQTLGRSRPDRSTSCASKLSACSRLSRKLSRNPSSVLLPYKTSNKSFLKRSSLTVYASTFRPSGCRFSPCDRSERTAVQRSVAPLRCRSTQRRV